MSSEAFQWIAIVLQGMAVAWLAFQFGCLLSWVVAIQEEIDNE